jgi:hypothetical protein
MRIRRTLVAALVVGLSTGAVANAADTTWYRIRLGDSNPSDPNQSKCEGSDTSPAKLYATFVAVDPRTHIEDLGDGQVDVDVPTQDAGYIFFRSMEACQAGLDRMRAKYNAIQQKYN